MASVAGTRYLACLYRLEFAVDLGCLFSPPTSSRGSSRRNNNSISKPHLKFDT